MTSTADIVRNIRCDQLGPARVRICRILEERLREALLREYQHIGQTVLADSSLNEAEATFRAGYRAGKNAGQTSLQEALASIDINDPAIEEVFRAGYRAAERDSGGAVDVNAENAAVQVWRRTYSLRKTEDITPAPTSNKLAGRKVLVEPEADLPIDEVGLGF